jgi:hypothetical protein
MFTLAAKQSLSLSRSVGFAIIPDWAHIFGISSDGNQEMCHSYLWLYLRHSEYHFKQVKILEGLSLAIYVWWGSIVKKWIDKSEQVLSSSWAAWHFCIKWPAKGPLKVSLQTGKNSRRSFTCNICMIKKHSKKMDRQERTSVIVVLSSMALVN